MAFKNMSEMKFVLNNIKNSIFNYIQYAHYSNNDILIMHDTAKLLAKQMRKGKFNRYDIIVRYLAIEQFYNKNTIGFDLYNKMQRKRTNAKSDTIQRMISLAQSIENFGFNNQSGIFIDRNFHLVDGSHRFASSLYFNRYEIPTNIYRIRKKIYYNVDWFKNNGFDDKELEVILQKKDEIFFKFGIYFPIILWPPIKDYFEEIKSSLSENYRIIGEKEYIFTDDFETFVKEIYSIDDIQSWKVEKKLEGMMRYEKVVKIIYIEIPEPRYRKKGINNYDISREVEQIKNFYRTEYQKRIDDYFHDIIMHIGDNYYHNRSINKILAKYEPYILKQ